MTALWRMRKTREALRAMQRAKANARERATATTREMISADAVRAPERMRADRYAELADAAGRKIRKLRRELCALEETAWARLRCIRSDARRAYLLRVFMLGEDGRAVREEMGVKAGTARRWEREEKRKED